MGRKTDGPPCVYCGEYHEHHEDAACGCSCGREPLECGACMRDGGPRTLAQKARRYAQSERDLAMDDMWGFDPYDTREW